MSQSVAKKLGVKSLYQALEHELAQAKEAKTYKYEVPVEGRMGGVVQANGRSQVMLASNNYLGLANHPRIVEAAKKGLDKYGYGLASVRFICGTQPIHLELEERIARFLGTEAAILHSSCFAANEAFFAAIVIPRSLSKSIESISLSSTCSLSRNVPAFFIS